MTVVFLEKKESFVRLYSNIDRVNAFAISGLLEIISGLIHALRNVARYSSGRTLTQPRYSPDSKTLQYAWCPRGIAGRLFDLAKAIPW